MVFACCAAPTAPYDEVDQLTREEVRALYRKCLEANNGRLIVSGLFARADVENNNKRLYPKGVLKREVARFRQNHVRAGTALGELDHPNYASRFFRCLNLPNVSHQVLDVHWLGSCLMGTIEILPTPSGLLLWELYARGVKLGVSSRGWASLKPDPRRNCTVVDEDFELITFDFVTEPSNKGAVMVPLTRPWAKPLPDQRRYVELAHLGMGMVHMEHLQGASHDPTFDAAAFMMRARDIAADAGCELHALPAGSGFRNPGTPQRHAEPGLKLPGYKGKRTELDKWLLYSHYLVNKTAKYLFKEPVIRDWRAHVIMFSARAHMVHPGWYVSRGHLNAVIAEEVSRPDAVTNTLEVAAVLFDGEQRMAAIQQQMQQAGGSSDYSSSVQKQPPPAAVAAQPTAATAAGVAPLEQRREQRSDAVAYIAPSATSAGDCTRVALSPELSLRRSTTSRPSSPPLANGTLSGALVEPDDVTTVAAPPDAARSRDTSSSSPDVLALKQQQQLRRTLSGSPSATSTSGGTAAVRQSVPTVLAESTEPLALPRTPPSRGGAGASTTAPLSPATPPGGCSGRDVSPHPVVSGNTTIYGSQVLVSDSGDTYLAPPDDLVRREFHKSNTLIKAYTESYHVTKSRVLTRVALAVANRLAAPAAAAAPPAVPSGKRGSGKGKQQGLGEQSQEGAGGEPSDRQAAVMALAQELAQLFRFELMHG